MTRFKLCILVSISIYLCVLNVSMWFLFTLLRVKCPFLCSALGDVSEAAMTSKGARENLVARLGFKSSNSVSKAEAELEKLKQENAHLRRKIDEVTKRHIRPPSSDKTKLLEVKNSLSCLPY